VPPRPNWLRRPGQRVGRYQSFTVRIWSRDDEELTHGQVVHVGTHKSAFFRDLSDLVAFIRQSLNGDPPPNAG
jgi:hypothetical protein